MKAVGSLAGEPFHPATLNVEVRSAWTRMSKEFHAPLMVLAAVLPMSAHIVELFGLNDPADVSEETNIPCPQADVPLQADAKNGVSMMLLLI